MDTDEFGELQNETKGSFGGIGVEISFQENAFIIVAPIEGTPAWKAGLQPQDKIIEINGKVEVCFFIGINWYDAWGSWFFYFYED